MAGISKTLTLLIAGSFLAVFTLASCELPLLVDGEVMDDQDVGQSPDMVVGTEDNAYKLFTPAQVVTAGGGAPGETTPLSDATPQPLGTPAPGSSADASRGDHVHLLPGQIAINTGAINAVRQVPPVSGQGSNLLAVNSGATAYQWESASSAVLRGLPALTGHGGNCLKVNIAGTGLEYGSCGSGGGGEGSGYTVSSAFTTTQQALASSGTVRFETNAAQLQNCQNSDAVIIRLSGGDVAGSALRNSASGNPNYIASFSWEISNVGRSVEVQISCNTAGTYAGISWDISGNSVRPTFSLYWVKFGSGSNGGGGTNPTIPAPTAAGSLKHLRVNQAGAAYELADPPDTSDVETQVDGLNLITSDLSPYPHADNPVYADNANATKAQIAFCEGCNSTPDISSLTFETAQFSKISGDWPAGYAIVRLLAAENKAQYRVQIVDSADGAHAEIGGNTWQQVVPSAGAASGSVYYAGTPVNERLGGNANPIKLQVSSNVGHIGKTTFAGDPTAVQSWAKTAQGRIPVSRLLPPLTGQGGKVLGVNTAATDVEWTDKGRGSASGIPAFAGRDLHLATNTTNDGLSWVEPPVPKKYGVEDIYDTGFSTVNSANDNPLRFGVFTPRNPERTETASLIDGAKFLKLSVPLQTVNLTGSSIISMEWVPDDYNNVPLGQFVDIENYSTVNGDRPFLTVNWSELQSESTVRGTTTWSFSGTDDEKSIVGKARINGSVIANANFKTLTSPIGVTQRNHSYTDSILDALTLDAFDLPNVPSDAARDKRYLVETSPTLNKWVASTDVFDILEIDSTLIAGNSTNIDKIQSPNEDTATSNKLDDGQLFTLTNCNVPQGEHVRTCTGEWQPPAAKASKRTLLGSGNLNGNSVTQAFMVNGSTLRAFMDQANGGFNEFEVYVQSGLTERWIAKCNIGGFPPTGNPNHPQSGTDTLPYVFFGAMVTQTVGRCDLRVPSTGNPTVSWDYNGGSSLKYWSFYGVEWN